ncbi:PAS domain-containing protein [Ekhidna sp.]
MNESLSIKELSSVGILDTFPEDEFDEIVELASSISGAPICLISLIDSDKLRFKAVKGLNAKQTSLKGSFCSYALKNKDQVTIVSDSLKDDRFKMNPLVTKEPYVRSYAGAPLITKNNDAIGTLCVLDNKPKEFSKEEVRMLEVLAKRVVKLLELRSENERQKKLLAEAEVKLTTVLDRLIEAQHAARIGSWEWDLSTNDLYWSPTMYEIFGLDESTENLIESWQACVHPDDLDLIRDTLSKGLIGIHNSIEYRIVDNQGRVVWVMTNGQAKVDDKGEVVAMMGTVQDITNLKKEERQRALYVQLLETMLFDLSHKIRQPLTNCMAMVDLFEQETISGPKLKEFAGYLKVSTNKIDSYVREMTDAIYSSKEKYFGTDSDMPKE